MDHSVAIIKNEIRLLGGSGCELLRLTFSACRTLAAHMRGLIAPQKVVSVGALKRPLKYSGGGFTSAACRRRTGRTVRPLRSLCHFVVFLEEELKKPQIYWACLENVLISVVALPPWLSSPSHSASLCYHLAFFLSTKFFFIFTAIIWGCFFFFEEP